MDSAEVAKDGRAADSELRSAVEIVHKQATSEPTFAGMWVDPATREIHLAFTDSTADEIVTHLQGLVAQNIRLRAHDARHSLATLENLHQAYSDYMRSTGYRSRYTVDSGIRIEANTVHANLAHTTPPAVIAAIRARFADAPLQIDLTTSRWSAY